MAASFWGITTGDADQRLLDIPLDLDLVKPWWLWLVIQGSKQPFGDQAFADTVDRSGTDRHGLGNGIVVLALIGGGGAWPHG